MKRLQLHPACKLFPKLNDTELRELAEDMRTQKGLNFGPHQRGGFSKRVRSIKLSSSFPAFLVEKLEND